MVGESAEKLSNARDILAPFAKQFQDENTVVQLQILSAVVKLFLKKPNEGQEIVQGVLQAATQSCDNPDIRDRAYIYWRLLSTSSQVAQTVTLAKKPPIEVATAAVSESLLDELIRNISSLASVYHKSPALFGQATIEIRRDE